MARKIKTLGVSGDSVFGQISEEISSESHAGEGSLNTLNLSDIDIDPKNARVIGRISPTDVEKHRQKQIDLTEESDPERLAYYSGIQEIANSISTNGLLHPIIVVVVGERYQIRAGERRYLAHLLLGLSTIRAFVRPTDANPFTDRAVSLIENVQRENLTTGELVSVIHEIEQDYQQTYDRLMTGDDLSDFIHKSERTCAVYLQLSRAPDHIYQQIVNNKLSINDARAVLGEGKLNEQQKNLDEDKLEPTRKGRKREAINLGKIDNSKIGFIEKIIHVMEGDSVFRSKYKEVDWTDPDKVQKIWTEFVTQMAQNYGK